MKTYRHWEYECNPPPVPSRGADWQASHEEYDGPGDNRTLYAATEEEIRAEIDRWWEEEFDPADYDPGQYADEELLAAAKDVTKSIDDGGVYRDDPEFWQAVDDLRAAIAKFKDAQR